MRRQRLNRMYYEAKMSDKGKGVSFSSMLFILAYHKMCGAPVNMEVSEFIERREMMNKLDARINLERVRGLLRGVYLRRRFLAERAERERQSVMHLVSSNKEGGFPSITVERPMSEAQHESSDAGMALHLHNDQDPFGTHADALSILIPQSMSGYTSSDDVESANASDVQLSPGSGSGPRRRLSFQNQDENPFVEQHSRGTHASSRLQPPFEMDTWTQVLHRLSSDTLDSDGRDS